MKVILRILLSLFIISPVFSQNSKWEHTDVIIQYRALHQPKALGVLIHNNSFSADLDLSVGTRWAYHLNSSISLSSGAFLNFSAYKREEQTEGIFFIDSFKGTNINAFNIKNISQVSIEIPLALQYDFYQRNANKIGLSIGVLPQIPLFSRIQGSSFDVDLTETDVSFIKEQNRGVFIDVFNDIYANTGLSYSHKISDKKSILFESGYEYSLRWNTHGLYLRTGFKF